MNHNVFASFVLLVPALVSSTGCSSADDATSSDPAEISAASLQSSCDAYARAVVAKQAECPTEMSDLDTSESATGALARTCQALFGAPGSDAAGAKMQTCTDAVSTASCLDFHGGLPACQPMFRGSLADDAECMFDNQCESGVCNGLSSSSCGHCAPLAGAGETCGIGAKDRACADGLVCLASTDTQGTCEPVKAAAPTVGDPCAVPSDCGNAWLSCDREKNKCVERGTSCSSPYSVEYDCLAGDTCSENGRCVAATIASAGQTCGSYEGIFCAPGLYCAYSSSGEQTCRTRVGEGGACSTTTAEQCATGLSCIDGTCAVPSFESYVCGGKQESGGSKSGGLLN